MATILGMLASGIRRWQADQTPSPERMVSAKVKRGGDVVGGGPPQLGGRSLWSVTPFMGVNPYPLTTPFHLRQ
jgi:hypothetical protein